MCNSLIEYYTNYIGIEPVKIHKSLTQLIDDETVRTTNDSKSDYSQLRSEHEIHNNKTESETSSQEYPFRC